jgi:hypothetical protein
MVSKQIQPYWYLQQLVDAEVRRLAPDAAVTPVVMYDDEKIQRHEDCYSRRFTLLESRKEPPESAKRNKTRGEISRKYGVNCSRSGRRSAFRSE